MTQGQQQPGPEDVAEARRSGTPPSTLAGDAPFPVRQPGEAAEPDDVVSGGGLTVRTRGAALLAARDEALAEAARTGLAKSLASKDPTLWGPDATPEATVRLGWLDAVDKGHDLAPRILALRQEFAEEGVDRFVLCGMGGSSLAPEVICASADVPLVVLDSTDPAQVRSALAVGDTEALQRTAVVVSSKSGGTIETDSQRRAARKAFEEAGIDPARRLVVVTDPDSPLHQQAEQEGTRAVFLADPDVGGRYSALTAFGLVPAGLAGADIEQLLDDAELLHSTLPDGGPALALGAALGAAAVAGRDKLVIADDGSGLQGFGDWAEQLVAESTGKEGKGILPVVVESPDAPGTALAADTHLVLLGEPSDVAAPEIGTGVAGNLGAQFLAWEYATAVAGRVLSINPFDQPNVQESKDNTGAILGGERPDEGAPLFEQDGVQVFAAGLPDARDLRGALDALLAAVPERGYLAVMAYLDRTGEPEAAQLRRLLAARLAHPVTFGWAPRFLHSTGQYHKGGPQNGVFLQVTAEVTEDLPVPGRDFTFGQLQSAQALGDLRALVQRGRPVLRVHLSDRSRGLDALLEAAQGAAE